MVWMCHCIFYLFLVTVLCFKIEAPPFQRIARSAESQSHSRVIREYDEDTLQLPEECKRLGICEYAPTDKDELVRSIIKDLLKKNKKFNQDGYLDRINYIVAKLGPAEDNN